MGGRASCSTHQGRPYSKTPWPKPAPPAVIPYPSLLRSLTQDSAWVAQHLNIFLLGPTGVGKSRRACALAAKACRDGFTAFFVRAPKLFRDLALARADGSLGPRLARLARIDVLIVDDWVHAPLAEGFQVPPGPPASSPPCFWEFGSLGYPFEPMAVEKR